MKNTTELLALKPANIGTISHGTLRTKDLLETFASELEWQIRRNGEYFAQNMAERDTLNAIVGEAQDCWAINGTDLDESKQDRIEELVNEVLPDALQKFCMPYFYFGSHMGDGSDFGYWVDIDNVTEQVEFVSSKTQEYPDDDFRGEWLHVSDHGNTTLYVRDNEGNDSEVWGVV